MVFVLLLTAKIFWRTHKSSNRWLYGWMEQANNEIRNWVKFCSDEKKMLVLNRSKIKKIMIMWWLPSTILHSLPWVKADGLSRDSKAQTERVSPTYLPTYLPSVWPDWAILFNFLATIFCKVSKLCSTIWATLKTFLFKLKVRCGYVLGYFLL